MERLTYHIIKHLNPKGRTTHYRAEYCDREGIVHRSLRYTLKDKRRAQAWLYANIKIWSNTAIIEQRWENGLVYLGTEEIVCGTESEDIVVEETQNIKKTNCVINRQQNTQGRTLWYMASYLNDEGCKIKNPKYDGKNQADARRAAQNWLYANTHCWVDEAVVSRYIKDGEKKRNSFVRVEKII